MTPDDIFLGVWIVISVAWFIGSIYCAVQKKISDINYDITNYVLSAVGSMLLAPMTFGFAVTYFIAMCFMTPMEKLVYFIAAYIKRLKMWKGGEL